MRNAEMLRTNKTYWDTNADLWFGTTALPTYGVKFVWNSLIFMMIWKKMW
jgi:hypothetical protein